MTVIWPEATPYPGGFPSIPLIQPFSYRDGLTFLEKFDKILDWINDELIPEFNDGIQAANDNYNTANTSWTSQFNSFMTNVNAALEALNDQAVADLVNTPTSHLAVALDAMFQTVSAATTMQGAIDSLNAAIPTLETIANATTAHTALQASIDAQLVKWLPNMAVTAGQVVVNPDGDVVNALDTHTAGATYDPDVARHWTGNFGYLMATFGNNVSPDLENLYINYSPDGKYVAGGANNPVYHAASTVASGVRDPSVMYFNGRWYCAHTINNGANKTIEIAVSDDLVNWTLNISIDLSSVVDTYAWAPEMDLDDDGTVVIHFTNVNVNGATSTHRTFWIRSENSTLTAWTAPVQQVYANLTALRPIDPCAIKIGTTWHIFYGNDGSIEHATATSLTGTWTVVGTGNWAGWYTDNPANSTIHYEGPEIIQVASNRWRIYFDQYTGATASYTVVGYWWSETSDPTLATGWTTPKQAVRSPGYADGCALRHGSWVKLPSSALQEQVLAATSAGGPRKIQHAEFISANGTVANAVYGAAGQTFIVDPNKSSSNYSQWVSLSGTTFTFLQNGEYTLEVIAPNTDVDMHVLGAGSYIALKGPLPNTTVSKIYASVDAASTAAAHTVGMHDRWMVAGDAVTVELLTANAMPADWQFLVVISKRS